VSIALVGVQVPPPAPTTNGLPLGQPFFFSRLKPHSRSSTSVCREKQARTGSQVESQDVTLATQSTHPSELWRGYWGVQVLQAGQTLGFFEALESPKSAAMLATERHLERRYVELWCEAAVSFGLLEKDGTAYQTPPHYNDWLLRSTGFTQSHLHLSRRMNETLAAVFGGRALPEPPISLRLLLQESLQANYQWLFQEAASASPAVHACLCSESRVLEVGCGIGFGLSYLRDYHPTLELFGLEEDYECAEEAERSTKAVIHIGELPGERFKREFDLIVAFRTLTASKDPKQLVTECAHLLKPEGLLILGSELSDENSERKCGARLQGERLAYNVLAGESLIRSYSISDIRALLEDCGLRISHHIKAPDWATPAFICTTAN
jgi:SAM-dependent methyltransferase